MDGRLRAAGTGGELQAEIDGSGSGVAYEVRGYKQGWLTNEQADGKPTAQIEPKSCDFTIWLVRLITTPKIMVNFYEVTPK